MGRVVCLAEVESWRSEVQVGSGEAVNGDLGGNAEGNESMDENQGKMEKGKGPLRGLFVATVEEVHEAFDWIKPIRYHQPLHLGGKYISGTA